MQRASGVPHALFGRKIFQRLGRMARRGRKRVFSRHCEERSDEAIHSFLRRDGLLRFARNDGLLWLFSKTEYERATLSVVIARQRVGRRRDPMTEYDGLREAQLVRRRSTSERGSDKAIQ